MQQMGQEEVMQRLNELTSNSEFQYVIAMIIANDFVGTIEQVGKKNYWEQLNYNEFAFVIGLWIKNGKVARTYEIDLNATYKEVHSLMEKLHITFLHGGHKFDAPDSMLNGTLLRESFFYSSTGAYDYQYIDKVKEKYKYDEEWLISNCGFSLKSVKPYFDNIKQTLNAHVNNPTLRKQRITKDILLSIFCLSKKELCRGSLEFENITSHLLIDPKETSVKELNVPGDFNEFITKPIIQLDQDRYFIPMIFFVAEALYECPYYWMILDTKYKGTGLSNRGRVAEEIVYDLFLNIFGSSKTFKDVKVKKNSTNTITDIDVAGLYNDTAILVQVKSKKLTSLSKKGDIDKIKEDFEKAVESAFIQGLKSKKCIEDSGSYQFRINDTDDISDNFHLVEKVYVICIVLDSYPGLAHLSHVLLYDKYTESTICLTAFDLEIVCKYLNTPERFIDYVHKRISNCRAYHAENEICFLGFYLQHDLVQHKKSSFVMITDDYGKKIDGEYHALYNTKWLSNSNKQVDKINSKNKIGRNDLCPCGSGAKYKKCHGKNG
jgi:hypothetical protein